MSNGIITTTPWKKLHAGTSRDVPRSFGGFMLRPQNPPATHHQIAIIKDTRLSRRDGALQHVQLHLSASSRSWGDGSRGAWMIVTNLRRDFERGWRSVER